MDIKSLSFGGIIVLTICTMLVGCATGTPQAKSSSFCTEVSDRMPKNTDISALEAYNMCMEMELNKRNKYRDDEDAAFDIAVGLLVDILG
jgi:hypothetical protein